VHRWTLPKPLRTPLAPRLSSMYVAILPTNVHCGEDTNFPQLTSVIPSDGLWGNITIGDVMSTTGGGLCYVYA